MPARPATSPFGPGLLAFLTELEANNTKTWFDGQKARYEADVREPALAFIRAMRTPLRKISGRFLAEDKKVGGSLMRIHRDVRFSKDKSPYKTNLGIQFRHEAGKDVHAPGLYLHVEPSESFLGVGAWRPEPDELNAIRQAILADPKGWVKARTAATTKGWTLGGESLQRPPKGYDADHPYVEDLRRKDHVTSCRLQAKDIVRKDFVPWVASRFLEVKPYIAFLARAQGHPI